MSSATYSELLRENRDFRRLWAGQMVSELGSWFSFIAELGLVRMLSGSALITTALLVARLLPFLLVAPFAGVLTDRKSRKQIMISADLLRGVVALLYVLAGAIGSAWMVVGCAALMASLTMFFEAAKNASIPNIVSPRELLTANVLMFSTRFLQYTIGSALGGVTAAQFGYNVAFVVNSLSFVASPFFLVLIPGNRMRQVQPGSQDEFAKAITFESEVSPEPSSDQPVVRSSEPPRQRFIADLKAGLSYIWATPFVRGLILLNIGWATGGGMTTSLFDRIGGKEFAHGGAGDWYVAALFTAGGTGVFFGMLVARRLGIWMSEERRAGRFIGWALLAHGLLFSAG